MQLLLIIRIIIIIGILGSITFISIKLSENRKHNEFLSRLRTEKYDEPDIIQDGLDNFIYVVGWDGLNLQKQVIIRVIENFPIINDPFNFGFNDAMGFAAGMNKDDIIEIYLDNNYWKKMNNDFKFALLYHELGHDILNLNHSKGKCDIMFPEISSCTIDDLMFKLQELNINRVELDLDFDLPELDLDLDFDLPELD